MDIIFKNLMERKNCVHALKRKYPGLSDYVRDNIAVVKMLLCESVDEYILGLMPGEEAPTRESIILAVTLRSEYTANSMLSNVMGRPLDWMYSKEKAEFYTRHVWELDKLYAKYKGEDHSFDYIVSDLRKNNSDLSFSGDAYPMVFQCWKNVMDIQDKWNPCYKREYFTETVIPNDKLSFIKKLKEILPQEER